MDYRLKPVDQLAVSFAKLFEFLGLVFKYLKDGIGRSAGPKAVGKGVRS